MSKKKKFGLALLALILIIQFFRPDRNAGEVYGPNDISKAIGMPADVKIILEKACNDCHSNNTVYPWYTNIQPLGWWLNHHVNEGKQELNFSEFNTYKTRRKLRKLEDIADEVKEEEMPLSSYTIMHGNAKLTDKEKQTLINWALNSKAMLDTVKIAEQPEK